MTLRSRSAIYLEYLLAREPFINRANDFRMLFGTTNTYITSTS